jgi:hypothetical protein
MTLEYGRDFQEIQDTDTSEHSALAKAKKVIDGPMIPAEHADGNRSINPIHAATGTELVLEQFKAYRLISSVPVYFRQTSESGVAVVGDIYLPANTPVIISTNKFKFVPNIAVASAGIIQALEVR